MTNITDFQKNQLEELGDDPVKASLELHREKLNTVAHKAIELIEEELPEATFADKIKAHDSAIKQMNIYDGRNETTVIPFIVVPGELAAQYDLKSEIEAQCQKNQNMKKLDSTQPKQKSQKQEEPIALEL